MGHYTDPSFNNLLALTILEESGETEKAGDLLHKISTSGNASNPVQQWVINYFNKNAEACRTLEMNFTNNPYFSLIKEIYKFMGAAEMQKTKR